MSTTRMHISLTIYRINRSKLHYSSYVCVKHDVTLILNLFIFITCVRPTPPTAHNTPICDSTQWQALHNTTTTNRGLRPYTHRVGAAPPPEHFAAWCAMKEYSAHCCSVHQLQQRHRNSAPSVAPRFASNSDELRQILWLRFHRDSNAWCCLLPSFKVPLLPLTCSVRGLSGGGCL